MHVRRIEWDDWKQDYVMQPTGGVSIAYTVDEVNKAIYASFVKCRHDPYTVKEKLAKQRTAERALLEEWQDAIAHGDDLTEFRRCWNNIQHMKTATQDLFCLATGRERAQAKLQAPDGDFEVLDLEHPITDTLADWLATVVWPQGPELVGYVGSDMGYAIDVYKNSAGHWVSEFEPSVLDSDFVADPDTDKEIVTAEELRS